MGTLVALAIAVPVLARAGTADMASAMMAHFMPHGMCYLWDGRLIALHVTADTLIAAAYFSIPVLLLYFVSKRPDIPFGAIFWMFGIFIIACGTTHVLEVWTVWHPAYWLLGAVKAITAIASVATAIVLVPLIPKALSFKSPSQLVEHGARYLRFIADASEALAGARSLQALLDALLEIIVPELADCVVVNFIEDNGMLRARAVHANPDLTPHIAGLLGAAYVKIAGEAPSALAIRTGKTHVLTETDQSYIRGVIEEPYATMFGELAARYALSVPLLFEDGAHGTFLAIRSGADSRAFNDAEILLFETLARRTVVAIENLDELAGLAHAASHDALTGLANRMLLADDVTAMLQRLQRRDGYRAAVLYLDLDRFKVVNDSLGHGVGDLLLRAIARRLEASIRPGDTFARVSGDEFVLLLCDIAADDEAELVAQRLLNELAAPFEIGDRDIFVTGSIGIAHASTIYTSCEDIMRDADIAMYRAKTLGKRGYATFEPAMRNAALKRMELDAELRRALERDELEVFYQPIIAFPAGTIEGFEALVRWRHPLRGLISPLDFIPIAEETGSIVKLGMLVLRAACAQTRHWQRLSPAYASLSINVNVSPKQIREPDYVAGVRSILLETGCPPSSLHLEITENVLMEERSSLTEALDRLRSIGVKLDIDDFGTGYSSLAYLHAFPIDALKIDQSFVSGSSDGLANPEIVKTILSLAKNLHLTVVAEGVETRRQEAELRALGCGFAQGYLFAKPMTATATTSYLTSFEASPIDAGTTPITL